MEVTGRPVGAGQHDLVAAGAQDLEGPGGVELLHARVDDDQDPLHPTIVRRCGDGSKDVHPTIAATGCAPLSPEPAATWPVHPATMGAIAPPDETEAP